MPIIYTPAPQAQSNEPNAQRYPQLLQQQRAFFATGTTLAVKFRKQQLDLLKQAIRRNVHHLTEALYADLHKPAYESLSTEIDFVEQELRLVRRHLDTWAKPRRVQETLLNFPATSFIQPAPYGTSLIIGSCSMPFNLLFTPLIGAMAAGNCVVLKPSEVAANAATVMTALIQETFDEAYIAVAQGGPELVQQLLGLRFDHIFFTGSRQVGQLVMKASANFLTPITLELGGKSPVIVTEDADLELAARRITWGKFLNAGQTCLAPDYVLVQEQVKEELLQLINHCIGEFYGENPELSPDYARIISDNQYLRLIKLLKQNNIRTGGQTNRATRYIAPTLLDRVSWEDSAMQQEIFGPILPILPYKSLKEVIQKVNEHEKPLAVYFFSSSKRKRQVALRCLHFGGCSLNDTFSHANNPYLPFGGVGASGMGSYHGKYSFDAFSYRKSVVSRGTWLDLPFRYPPYLQRIPILHRILHWF